jgi:hypothetical protein
VYDGLGLDEEKKFCYIFFLWIDEETVLFGDLGGCFLFILRTFFTSFGVAASGWLC